MTTKHAPATPLPYEAISRSLSNGALVLKAPNADYSEVACLRERELRDYSQEDKNAQQDAAYIAHAANAYPRLVEALRDCLRALSKSDEFKVRHGSGVAQADGLLRELGELDA